MFIASQIIQIYLFGFNSQYVFLFAKIDIRLAKKELFKFLISWIQYLIMQKKEIQQFARFFLKELKSKNQKFNDNKNHIDQFKFSSSS